MIQKKPLEILRLLKKWSILKSEYYRMEIQKLTITNVLIINHIKRKEYEILCFFLKTSK